MWGKHIYGDRARMHGGVGYTGSARLGDLFSYNTASAGISNLHQAYQRYGYQTGQIGKIWGQSRQIYQARKEALSAQDDRAVKDAQRKIAMSMRATAATLADPALKASIHTIIGEMNAAAATARNLADKQRILERAQTKIRTAAQTATGADIGRMGTLTGTVDFDVKTYKEGQKQRNINRLGLQLRHFGLAIPRAMGNALRTLQPLKKSLDISNQLFRQFNYKANQFAKMQMEIASERGATGRKLRGAGINFGNMMAALGAGRKAGMSDQDIIAKALSMQQAIARSRWGEGNMIDTYGKWGLSPFKDSGNGMKSQHELMLDISKKLSSMTDEMEQLHLLADIGASPEQKEYYLNYAKEAAKFEGRKQTGALGTLENAKILDSKGYYAKVAAATDIEQKRQQILNQNATDQGFFAAIKRYLNPENWLFSDVMARQRGVREARAQEAFKQYKEKGFQSLSAEQRKDIAYYGEAEKRNLGDRFRLSEEYKERQKLEKFGVKFGSGKDPLEKIYKSLTSLSQKLGEIIERVGTKFADFLGGPGVQMIERLASRFEDFSDYLIASFDHPKEAINVLWAEFKALGLQTVAKLWHEAGELSVKTVKNAIPTILSIAAKNILGTAAFGFTLFKTRNLKKASAAGIGAGLLAEGLFGEKGNKEKEGEEDSDDEGEGFAEGGIVPGPKGQTGDKVLIRANPGELVLNEKQQKILGLQRFEDGGVVQNPKVSNLSHEEKVRALKEFYDKKKSQNESIGDKSLNNASVFMAGMTGAVKGAAKGLAYGYANLWDKAADSVAWIPGLGGIKKKTAQLKKAVSLGYQDKWTGMGDIVTGVGLTSLEAAALIAGGPAASYGMLKGSIGATRYAASNPTVLGKIAGFAGRTGLKYTGKVGKFIRSTLGLGIASDAVAHTGEIVDLLRDKGDAIRKSVSKDKEILDNQVKENRAREKAAKAAEGKSAAESIKTTAIEAEEEKHGRGDMHELRKFSDKMQSTAREEGRTAFDDDRDDGYGHRLGKGLIAPEESKNDVSSYRRNPTAPVTNIPAAPEEKRLSNPEDKKLLNPNDGMGGYKFGDTTAKNRKFTKWTGEFGGKGPENGNHWTTKEWKAKREAEWKRNDEIQNANSRMAFNREYRSFIDKNGKIVDREQAEANVKNLLLASSFKEGTDSFNERLTAEMEKYDDFVNRRTWKEQQKRETFAKKPVDSSNRGFTGAGWDKPDNEEESENKVAQKPKEEVLTKDDWKAINRDPLLDEELANSHKSPKTPVIVGLTKEEIESEKKDAEREALLVAQNDNFTMDDIEKGVSGSKEYINALKANDPSFEKSNIADDNIRSLTEQFSKARVARNGNAEAPDIDKSMVDIMSGASEAAENAAKAGTAYSNITNDNSTNTTNNNFGGFNFNYSMTTNDIPLKEVMRQQALQQKADLGQFVATVVSEASSGAPTL